MGFYSITELGLWATRRGLSPYPVPSTGNPYVYLTSLLSTHTEFKSMFLAQRVGHRASALLSSLNTNLFDERAETTSIQKGLNFLLQAADKMRAHELSFINNEIKRLEKLGNLGTEEKKLIEDLKKMQNGDIDYKTFINGLNSLLSSIQKYKKRIEAFNKHSIVNTPQLNMVTSLPTLLNEFTNHRAAIYYSQEEVIRQLTFEYLKRYGEDFIKKVTAEKVADGATDLAAATALISQQLAQYIYENKDEKGNYLMKYNRSETKAERGTRGKFVDFNNPESFIKKIQELYDYLDDFEKTHNMSKIFGDERLLQDIKEMYGIEYDKDSNNNNMKATGKAKREIKQVLSILGHDTLLGTGKRSLTSEMAHIKVKWNSNAQHPLSYVAELTSSLLTNVSSHQHLGRQNLGTDILLGVYSIETKTNKTPDKVQTALEQIAHRISHEGARDDISQLGKIYTEELDKLSQTLEKTEKAFILHETTKNYNTLERGQWPGTMKAKGFEGRSMNIFNYIDAMASFGSNLGINTEWLKFIAYNLADDALGAMYKSPLESLFAICGGIIMFDDFATMGQEIINTMPSNVENIHLYKLQGTYFPASFFLESTYYAFMEGANSLMEGNGFTASIDAPAINYYDNPKIIGAFAGRWPQVKHQAEISNKVTLHFGANFLSLMSQLL